MRIHDFYPLLFFFCFVVSGNSEELTSETTGNGSIVISVAPFHEGQVFSKQVLLASESYRDIEIDKISQNVSFIIVQIHILDNNVTLFINNSANEENANRTLFGSNIGFEIDVENDAVSMTAATVFNPINQTVNALIAAVTYSNNAPIPGGCNSGSESEISPYQKLRLTEATVIVDGQRASAPRTNRTSLFPCEKQNVNLVTYRMYLTEGDFTEETYFNGLLNMMTVEGILKHGTPVRSRNVTNSLTHHVYGAYPGTGSIYAVIATYGDYSSAYVPAASYACNPLADPSSCLYLNSAMSIVLFSMAYIFGSLLFYFNCLRYPRTEVAFIGMIFGGILGFTIHSAAGHSGISSSLYVMMGGIVMSGFFVFWSFCESAILLLFSSSMIISIFLAGTISLIIGDAALFDESRNFWLIYAGITLAVIIMLMMIPSTSVWSAILISYSMILCFDYLQRVGSLKYIIIDTVRRATVADFSSAVVQPPIQSGDIHGLAFIPIFTALDLYAPVIARCFCRIFCCRRSEYREIEGRNEGSSDESE